MYVSTLSVEKVMEKNTELVESIKKAGITEQQQLVENIIDVVGKQKTTNEESGVVMKVYASQNQMNQILDFMQAIGVEYELF